MKNFKKLFLAYSLIAFSNLNAQEPLEIPIEEQRDNKIKALSVKRYNYKTRPGTTYTGFLAHEVAEVVDGVARGTKDAVNPDGTPDYQGMDLSKLVPELVSAIQELEARVKTLEG